MSSDLRRRSRTTPARVDEPRRNGGAEGALRNLATRAAPLLGLLLLCSLPAYASGNELVLQIAELCLIYGLLAVSLNWLLGYLGWLSFAHVGFFAGGGYAAVLVYNHLGHSLLEALGITLVGAALVSLAVGRATLRLKGFYFAITTLAATAVLQTSIVDARHLTGGSDGLLMDLAHLSIGPWQVDLTNTTNSYYLTLCVAAVILLGGAWYAHAGIGRVVMATRDNELLARTWGLHAARLRLVVFVAASCVAAIAGLLYAVYFQFISPGAADISTAINILLMLVLGGTQGYWTPLLGVIPLTVIPQVTNLGTNVLLFGEGIALLAVIILLPRGLWSIVTVIPRRRGRGRALAGDAEVEEFFEQVIRGIHARAGQCGQGSGVVRAAPVELRGISKRFGGVAALVDVEARIEAGEVFGIIGANGSGKTTLFNVLSGVLPPDAGEIRIGGEVADRLSPERAASLGIVRTFQEGARFGSMRLREAMAVAECGSFGPGVWSSLRHAVSERASFRSAKASVELGTVSYGHQRLAEISIAMSRQPAVLLLDEPLAGLGGDESERILSAVRRIRETGVAVVIVEHHMDAIASVSDRLLVLDGGRVLTQGPVRAVLGHPDVVRIYLGELAAPSGTGAA